MSGNTASAGALNITALCADLQGSITEDTAYPDRAREGATPGEQELIKVVVILDKNVSDAIVANPRTLTICTVDAAFATS